MASLCRATYSTSKLRWFLWIMCELAIIGSDIQVAHSYLNRVFLKNYISLGSFRFSCGVKYSLWAADLGRSAYYNTRHSPYST